MSTATARLVASMLDGSHVSAEFAAFLYEHTAGIPLAVEESVRLMVDRGDIFSRNGQLARRRLADIAVPPTVRDAVLERVRRLDRNAAAVLWAAAVFADPADERIVCAMTGLPAGRVRDGLGEALRSGLLAEDGRGLASFRHVLVGRVVYEAIPGPQRRTLHLRAGHLLEQAAPLPVAQLATHFRGAGDTGKWCEYAEQAADNALTPGDEATASALLHDLVTGAELPAPTLARLTGKISFTSPPGVARCEELVRALRSALERPCPKRRRRGAAARRTRPGARIMEDFEASYAELERRRPTCRAAPPWRRGRISSSAGLRASSGPCRSTCAGCAGRTWRQKLSTPCSGWTCSRTARTGCSPWARRKAGRRRPVFPAMRRRRRNGWCWRSAT